MELDEVIRLKQISGLRDAFAGHVFSHSWEEFERRLEEEEQEREKGVNREKNNRSARSQRSPSACCKISRRKGAFYGSQGEYAVLWAKSQTVHISVKTVS